MTVSRYKFPFMARAMTGPWPYRISDYDGTIVADVQDGDVAQKFCELLNAWVKGEIKIPEAIVEPNDRYDGNS